MGPESTKPQINGQVDVLLVPPGFVSLSSFTLKRLQPCQEASTSLAVVHLGEAEATPVSSAPSSINIEKFKSNLGHRPWILDNQYNPRDSSSKEETYIPLRTCLPRGVIRGCSSCPNCQKVIARWQPEEPHRPELEVAPVFHPTEEEFKETLQYIASIHRKAEHIGMCRIVPPPSWQPPYLVREKNIWENLKFGTHVQLVNELQGQILKTKMGRAQEEKKIKRRKVCTSSEDGCIGADAKESQCNSESCISISGPELTLKTFEKYADDFKRQYFSDKDKGLNSNANFTKYQEGWEPSVENVEGEYWRIIENPGEEIEVLCSENFENGVPATGFPVNHNSKETPNYPEYLESGWNLNNTFKLRGSLLCFEDHGTHASLLPHLSVGMCFSSVCWKVEEHHLYSLCYLHLGGPKTWYIVPGRYCYRFERVVKKHLPQCLEHPESLYKNISQLSPHTLIAEGIPVYRCVQYPREFVVIFPAAYSSQFDCGFSCSEAITFAPFDWLPYGQHAIDMYSNQARRTSISFDKMLLRAAVEAVSAQWHLLLLKQKFLDDIPWTSVCGKGGALTKALKSRVKHEAIRREYLCKSLQSQKMEDKFDLHTKRECSICLYDLHFSAIGCSCSPDRYACLQHGKDLCSCPWTNRYLLVRYEIDELNILVGALEGKLDAVYNWGKKKLGLSINSGNLKDAVQIPKHGEVSALLNAAAGSHLSEGKRDSETRQKSRSEQKENEVVMNARTPDSFGRRDTAECDIDSQTQSGTCEKEKLENSHGDQSVVIVLSDDED